MIEKIHKDWIDNATYLQLLSRWRFSPSGDPALQGETGDYYRKIMKERKPSDDEAARISKRIGWNQ